MRAAHLSRLRIAGAELDDLVRLHAQWALGEGPFAALRESRLAAGVPADLAVEAVVGERGGDWTFKFSLPDVAGVAKTSAIRITQHRSGPQVDHLVVRDGAIDRLAIPSADSPEVVRWMLEHLATIEPPALRQTTAQLIDEPQVAGLVESTLSPSRKHPLLLVSVENATRAPLVDADALAHRLAGMVTVHRLASVRVSYRLRDELTSVGLDEKLGCYNGGVRILWPEVQPGDNPYDHLLVLPMRLFGMPAPTRTEQVAGLFAELIAEGEDLRRWLRDVDGPAPPPAPRPTMSRPLSVKLPIAARPEPAVAPTPQAIAPRVVPAPAPTAALAPAPVPGPAPGPAPAPEPEPPCVVAPEPDAPIAPIQDATTPPPVRAAKSTWQALADDLAAGLQLADEQERELETMRGELALARRDLRRAEQERDEIRGSLGPPRTVAAALAHAEAMFADQLVVLRSARTSAEDSPYRDAPRVLFVLALLANCDAGGIGEVIHRALGTMARWKPKDSPETVTTFGRERTWIDHAGVAKTFGRHITLGHGVSAQKCLQIYYDVLGDGRVEVAWCGEHRPTVGEDT